MKTFTLALIGTLVSFSAFATEEIVVDHNKTVITKVPHTVTVCENVRVTENRGDVAGGALIGALIGGAIGNNIGDSKNNGAAGAIIGGIIGGNEQAKKGTTTRTERRCKEEVRYTKEYSRVYSHSTVTFIHEGRQVVLTFDKYAH